MTSYSYVLTPKNESNRWSATSYTLNQLDLMTTHHLREICVREKLVESRLGLLDRHELIEIIMRYRGAPEHLLIIKPHPGGKDRLESLVGRIDKYLDDKKTIASPSRIVVYEGLDTDKYDNYIISAPGILAESNVLLISGEKELCAVFNLKTDKNNSGQFFLTRKSGLFARESENKHYSLLYFQKSDSELIYKLYYDADESLPLPKGIKCYKMPLLNFEVKKAVATSQTLAIDFGTTNTTAGVYLDRDLYNSIEVGAAAQNFLTPEAINFVKVYENTGGGETLTPLIPSVVGVWKIAGSAVEKIEYIFGYEAVKFASLDHMHNGFSVFFDIKRWIRDCERSEEITDTQGRRIFIKRKEIIKAFLEYIVATAEQRFKCRFQRVHMSAPVKEKENFRRVFNEFFPAIQVEAENMLDEGTAVLFNNIATLIETNPNQHIDKEVYQSLIVDCGGGTTDLSSCYFTIESNRVSYKIKILTTYENGDTNFGGNNLAFRIMQLIKIALAERLSAPPTGQNTTYETLAKLDGDIYRQVDKKGINDVYRQLDAAYAAAEAIIPTKFKNYESGSPKDYYKVKNNFFFLFQLAERIKKEVFSNSHIDAIILDSENKIPTEAADKVIPVGYWRLAAYEKDTLKSIREVPRVKFTANNINFLLKADIYEIVRKFFEELYEKDMLTDYDIIRLTGQSCKTALFKDALKEFIPGRKIEFGTQDSAEGAELKLACLRGAIKYLNAKTSGYAEITVRHSLAGLPYVITANTHMGEEKILISRDTERKPASHISRFKAGIALKLYLKDTAGQERFTYVYENKRNDFKPVTYQDIAEKYEDNIIQDETDNVVDNEVKFFVWLQESHWAFIVVPIMRQESELYLGREQLFAFENDLWENNFFDGLK